MKMSVYKTKIIELKVVWYSIQALEMELILLFGHSTCSCHL